MRALALALSPDIASFVDEPIGATAVEISDF